MSSDPEQDSSPMIAYFTDKYYQTVTKTCCKKTQTGSPHGRRPGEWNSICRSAVPCASPEQEPPEPSSTSSKCSPSRRAVIQVSRGGSTVQFVMEKSHKSGHQETKLYARFPAGQTSQRRNQDTGLLYHVDPTWTTAAQSGVHTNGTRKIRLKCFNEYLHDLSPTDTGTSAASLTCLTILVRSHMKREVNCS